MGSVLILILTGFFLACIHFNAKETARINAVAVEDDITRVQAQVTAVQTVYWTKEKVDNLTVWYGDESYCPKWTSLSKDKVIVHRGRHRSGYGFYRKSDGSLGTGWVSGTGYGTYVSPDLEIGTGWTVSGEGRTPDREGDSYTVFLQVECPCNRICERWRESIKSRRACGMRHNAICG